MARIRTRVLVGVGLIVATMVGLSVESTAGELPEHMPAAPDPSGEAEQLAREYAERERALMENLKALEAELSAREAELAEEYLEVVAKLKAMEAENRELSQTIEEMGAEMRAEYLPERPGEEPVMVSEAEHLPVRPEPSREEAKPADEQPPTAGSPRPEPRWHTTIEVALSSGVLVFGALLVALELRYLKSRGEWDAMWTMKIVGLTLVLTAGMFLITAGFSQNQTAPMMGLLGTVAGYLLGRQAVQRSVVPPGP
jgi:hypothetical protein